MPYRVRPSKPETLCVRVGTQSPTGTALLVAALCWIGWALLMLWLALSTESLEGLAPSARWAQGLLLSSLGFLPALAAFNATSSRTRHGLVIDEEGVRADGLLVLRFEQPLQACVLDAGEHQSLVIFQDDNWIVLHGTNIGGALGGDRTWGRQWHSVRSPRLGHRREELGSASAWPGRWATSDGPSVIGEVDDRAELAELADRVRNLATGTAAPLLVLPTASPEHPAIVCDRQGVLHAFGEKIDTREPFDCVYVWAYGKENDRGDADAMILTQGDHALRLSISEQPGRWPTVGALPTAVPEIPLPEVPREEVINAVAFGAIDQLVGRARSER